MPVDESSEPIVVGVYYDFASSLCYMAHRIMERLADEIDELGIHLKWLPLDLTLVTDWRRGDPIKGKRRNKILSVADDLEVAIEAPGHWMDSRVALAIALELEGTEKEAAWREAVWTSVYGNGECLDSPELLARLARSLDLETATELDDGRLLRLDLETEKAAAAGVYGVPTFMLDIWPIGGIQDEPTMRTFLSRWANRQRQPEAAFDVN